jgi:hypothetical protein
MSRQFSRNDPHFGQTIRDINRNIYTIGDGTDLTIFSVII